MAFFEGLVVTEDGAAVDVASVGGESCYVIDDHGFRRHIEAKAVDRVVLSQFTKLLSEHQDEATEAMLRMMGKDDIFTKAMVDTSLRQMDVEKLLDERLPVEARQWLGMLGFQVVVNWRGEVVHVELPSAPDPESWDE